MLCTWWALQPGGVALRDGFGHLTDLVFSGRGLAACFLWVLGQLAYWPLGPQFPQARWAS